MDDTTLAEHDGPCELLFECDVGGRYSRPLAYCRVDLEEHPGGQYPQSISVLGRRPRKRRPDWHRLRPDGGAWYVLSAQGKILCDTRDTFAVFADLDSDRAARDDLHALCGDSRLDPAEFRRGLALLCSDPDQFRLAFAPTLERAARRREAYEALTAISGDPVAFQRQLEAYRAI